MRRIAMRLAKAPRLIGSRNRLGPEDAAHASLVTSPSAEKATARRAG
jgi:hypothetical protein